MKKYLLFAGENYYPKGGMNDFKGSFDTVEESENEYYTNEVQRYNSWEWYQIVDSETLDIVKQDGSPYGSC
jgi:hypothetical protein